MKKKLILALCFLTAPAALSDSNSEALLKAIIGTEIAALVYMVYHYTPSKMQARHSAIVLKFTDSVEEKDPELYNVFLKIKEDYGIVEDIHFRMLKPLNATNLNTLETDAYFLYADNDPAFVNYPFLIINSAYKSWTQPETIHILAHELEHCRQRAAHSGSYSLKNNKEQGSNILSEQAADAASADYQYCKHCLNEIVTRFGHTHEPKDTDFGSITTSKGYFSCLDYMIYQQRAQEANALCKAHAQGTDHNLKTPLKDFLPQPDSDIKKYHLDHATLYLYS
jgi:hypothetical protein